MSTNQSGPFDVDEGKAFDALLITWGDLYDDLTLDEGIWSAHRIGAPADELVTGQTPDELNEAMREDWARRNPQPPRGPSGIGPS